MHRHRNRQHHHGSMDQSGKSTTSNSSSSRSGNNKRRALDWRPRTPELRKNRKLISQCLKRINGNGKTNNSLSLDQNGVCCFSFNKFVICVEVPDNNSSICLFNALVCHLHQQPAKDNREEVQKFIRLYNTRHNNHNNGTYSSSELDASSSEESSMVSDTVDPLDIMTHGIRLFMGSGNNNNEVNLCLSFPIKGLKQSDFEEKLEYYLKICLGVNKKLDRAKATPFRPPPPQPSILAQEEAQRQRSCRLRMWSVDSQTSVSNMSQCSLFSLFGKSPSFIQLSQQS